MSYAKFLDSEGTFDEIRDRWISEKRYSELSAFIHENWDFGQWDDFFEPFEKHLIKEKQIKEFKKFWKGLLRHRLNELWDLLKEYNIEKKEHFDLNKKSSFQYLKNLFFKPSEPSWETIILEQQKETLIGLNRFLNGLVLLNDDDEILKTKGLIQQVEKLEKPRTKSTVDSRKIDEDLFWNLIVETRKTSEDKYDFITNLSSRLEEFKPIEVRRFERILLSKIEELNDWNTWAIAYVVRRGCGDDEFDYFRAWAVSKGPKTFYDLKNFNLKELEEHFVDEDPQLEEMFNLCENVFENKTGEIMNPVRVKRCKTKGNKWKEENISVDFPELCAIFGY